MDINDSLKACEGLKGGDLSSTVYAIAERLLVEVGEEYKMLDSKTNYNEAMDILDEKNEQWVEFAKKLDEMTGGNCDTRYFVKRVEQIDPILALAWQGRTFKRQHEEGGCEFCKQE